MRGLLWYDHPQLFNRGDHLRCGCNCFFFENPQDDTQEAATDPLHGTCARLWHELEVCHALPLGAITEIFLCHKYSAVAGI